MSDLATTSSVPAIRQPPIPTFLGELGVRILHDEQLNARIVAIPGAIRERVNVIDPVTSLVQADPNWTPRISVIELDPSPDGPHWYKQKGGKLAPTKQALEALAKGAGILYARTSRIAKEFLDDAEPWAYMATIAIRRSDGTIEEITRERSAGEDASDRAHGRAKTESKAVLRAIRAALQIPHTFTPQDAAKPFLVIGFNFTPDYNDHEVKRALVAAGLNAQAAIYGTGGSVPTERVSLESGEILPAADEPADVVEPAPPGGGGADLLPLSETASGTDLDGGQQAGETGTDTDPVSPVPGDEEPSLGDTSGYEPPAAAVAAAAAAEVPTGDYSGRSLESIAVEEKGPAWLTWALQRPALHWPVEFRGALETFVRARLPEVWTSYEAWRQA